MSSRPYRMLRLAPLIILALVLACGSAATPTTSTPTTDVSSAPTAARRAEPAGARRLTHARGYCHFSTGTVFI